MHDSSTLPIGRRQLIADRLARGEPVVSAELAQEFAISEDAIRRDLRALAEDGVCRKVYGGALPVSPASKSMEVRSGEQIVQKRALARAALALLREGETIFLDVGSTNLQLANILPGDLSLRVVTNSVPVAAALMTRPDLDLIVIGGGVNVEVGGCVDARSIADMRRYRVDLCFLGACALSRADGLAAFHLPDVDFKQALLEASGRSALMMTTAKLDTTAPFRIAPLSDIDHFILEPDAPAELIAELRRSGSDTVLADPRQD